VPGPDEQLPDRVRGWHTRDQQPQCGAEGGVIRDAVGWLVWAAIAAAAWAWDAVAGEE
jgi:hypothetical protein